ncbi:MAG: glucosidase [Candidatus Eremiobacteraeota bacterium]|nr:glucosidase [Candidatus Eremiobacteraeota bacterium]
MTGASAERRRVADDAARTAHWSRWGPYLAERQWGTVREDYSADGSAWNDFPHDHARSRAYRWGEDGIAGISDNHQRLCLALALWNGNDAILKERFFGLTGAEGNHGEDVKEYYFYQDNVPSHAYMRMLYKYPQRAFPYAQLVAENARRGRGALEYELLDTGAFVEDRYFDVTVEYAKAGTDDVLMRVTAVNRGPDEAVLDLLPTLWFRNTWSWTPGAAKPVLRAERRDASTVIAADHVMLGARWLYADAPDEVLFTENETNSERLYGRPNDSPYVKDGIDAHVVHGRPGAVNPAGTGTKAALRWRRSLAPGEAVTIRLRLTDREVLPAPFGAAFDATFAQRRDEADAFYAELTPYPLSDDARAVQRRAFAGLLWSKQWYHYVVRDWLDGDAAGPPPPDGHRDGRNRDWRHLYSDEILSMPDTWEYPWFAAWDLAFHVIPLALVDAEFAKRQLLQLTREWFMHPNGQLPAYEWAFDDVNPPVHAWAAHRVFKIDAKMKGVADVAFLERVFQKLLLNFTWWVNRKDRSGRNVFQGGFLGLDNIGVFDRSAPLPTGGHIDQSDGTSWMGVYALNMLAIALELAQHNRAYEDIASKFFEHFLRIAAAMNDLGGRGLWHADDGFYYDVLHLPDESKVPMRVRSVVGLIPLLAVEIIEPHVLEALPEFTRRMEWFIENRPELKRAVACMETEGVGARRMLAIVGAGKGEHTEDRLRTILRTMLDENEFFGDYGIRAVSRHHCAHPYELAAGGAVHRVAYEPAESSSGLFGGNSNWRGPVWFPINYLLVEALQKYHHYLGDDYRVALPTGGGREGTLWDVATELSHRLIGIFTRGEDGRRPVFGGNATFQDDPRWRNEVLFYEYFHGDNGAGIGASHQTGWTGLVAKLLQQCAEHCGTEKSP